MSETEEIQDLNNVKFFVEANSYEQQTLWERCHDGKDHYGVPIDWKQIMLGYARVLGEIKSGEEKLQINVSFNFARINGKLICFYYACSRGIDHGVIKKYLEPFTKTYNGNSTTSTDAQNFHLCIHALNEL